VGQGGFSKNVWGDRVPEFVNIMPNQLENPS
jgi:hypothetical protein